MDNRKKPPPSDASDTEQQQACKPANRATNVVTCSTVNDSCVLFGRGKACNNHPGNKRMRVLIDQNRDAYQTAERGEKKMIVLKVHRELVEEGMKFLKQEEGIDGWIEADAEEAIKKVGHAIRCNRNRGKGESAFDRDVQHPPAAARVASAPRAMGSQASQLLGQLPQNHLAGVGRADISASLALAGISTMANSGLSSTGAVRQLLGGSAGLPIGTNPLQSLGNLRMQLNGLNHPSLSASMGLAQPTLPSSMALSGLSQLEIYILMERERQQQEAMLYDKILRNAKKR